MNNLIWVAAGLLIASAVVLLVVRLLAKRTEDGKPGLLNVLPQGVVESLEREKRRAGEILQRMTEGVLVLDEDLRPEFANRAAREMLGLAPGSLPARLPALGIAEVAAKSQQQRSTVLVPVDLYYPQKMTVRVEAAPLSETSGVLVVLQDVSEELHAQRIRREFVAHASHELKSPVASLQTLADAIAQALPEDLDAAERFAAKLSVESARMGKLVSDLLDLSRLEDPSGAPEQECDLADVARRELPHAEMLAHEHDVALTWQIDPVTIRGERNYLALLVRNLLENAVQYTNEGGNVRLDVGSERGAAVVRVSDDGVGIPSDAQARVFERFYRVDRARSRDRGGTGLGLAIVKHVAELHGGRVELESELGRGSTFTARFPLIEASPAEDRGAPVDGAPVERGAPVDGAPVDRGAPGTEARGIRSA